MVPTDETKDQVCWHAGMDECCCSAGVGRKENVINRGANQAILDHLDICGFPRVYITGRMASARPYVTKRWSMECGLHSVLKSPPMVT